jgi:large subunit ribosomal protein L13
MNTTSYKTKSVNKETADKKWIIVDANDQVLGRFASRVAYILRGKNKVTYTPHADTGDNVIVINSANIRLTGNKLEDKEYIHYTGYPGGQRFNAAKDLIKDKPNRIIEKAVKGMLPKTKLGNEVFRNLYVYEGAEHPHEGQKPVQFDINTIK